MKRSNLVGSVYGRLTVTADAGGPYWECKCICGKVKITTAKLLNSGKTSSCGCLSRDVLVSRNTTHGLSKKTSAYRTWKDMRARCFYQKSKDYKDYGGRGITVCERWDDFNKFYQDMGDRPAGMTIDRIDVNGDYFPGNCKWSNAMEQANNKRTNRIVEIGGSLKTLSQLCREAGIDHSKVGYRLRNGYTPEQSISMEDYRR